MRCKTEWNVQCNHQLSFVFPEREFEYDGLSQNLSKCNRLDGVDQMKVSGNADFVEVNESIE